MLSSQTLSTLLYTDICFYFRLIWDNFLFVNICFTIIIIYNIADFTSLYERSFNTNIWHTDNGSSRSTVTNSTNDMLKEILYMSPYNATLPGVFGLAKMNTVHHNINK